jgi:hypothetical protein
MKRHRSGIAFVWFVDNDFARKSPPTSGRQNHP